MATASQPATTSPVSTPSERAHSWAAFLLAWLRAKWVRALGVAVAIAPELEPEILAIDRATGGHYGRASQVGTIIAGVVIGAALLIGFFVISSISDAIPFTTIYDDPANESLVQDRNSTLDRIGDGLLIGGVVIIVLYSAVILRVLRGL